MKNVIKKSRSILSIALVLTIALSQVLSLTGSFFNVKADPVKTLADLQALLEEADRVAEEAEEDPYRYSPSTYQRLLKAIEKAQEAYNAGVEDGTELQTVNIVGGPDDSKWEVKNPDSMAPGYTPYAQQVTVFGADHMVFVPYGADLVRCTYAGGQGQYGVGGQFGEIDFRYNRSANPLELDFKNDTIDLEVQSGFYYAMPLSAVKKFTIILSFAEDIPDITIPWLVSGSSGQINSDGSGYITPDPGPEGTFGESDIGTPEWRKRSKYETTINLADVLTAEYAQEYVNTYLAPLDYKVNVEYIYIDQDVDYNGDNGLSFLIHDFTLTDVNTDFDDAYNELQAAIDGLEIDYIGQLQELIEQWEDEPKGIYSQASYDALQAALAKANSIVAAGVPDGFETVSIVGRSNDSKWEVKNPDSMDAGYTSKADQETVFGAQHIQFVSSGVGVVRCTYTGGQDQYGVSGQFGGIDFRYNRSENPLELDFENDSISMSFMSGFAPNYPPHAVKDFTIVLSFEEDIPDISIPWMMSGIDYASPDSASVFIADLNLADVLTKWYAQDYVNTYLAPLDYKVNVEYIRIDQAIDSNGDVGLSFVINDFTLTDVRTDAAEAYEAMQAAVSGLEADVEISLRDGAKIRTSGNQGLMFGTVIDTEVKQYYVSMGFTPVAYGTVLLPADLIPDGQELIKNTPKAVYREFPVSEYPPFTEYNVHLIGWTEESQMTRDITARSYVVYEKEGEDPITVYSGNTVTRSVYTVAINIYNSEHIDAQLENNLENGRIAFNWLISQ